MTYNINKEKKDVLNMIDKIIIKYFKFDTYVDIVELSSARYINDIEKFFKPKHH